MSDEKQTLKFAPKNASETSKAFAVFHATSASGGAMCIAAILATWFSVFMKYNLSKIMLKAWKIYRKTKNISFAEALHRAWLSAKAE